MDLALRAIDEADEAPSVSRFIEREATLDAGARVRRCTARAYQLKEADPHSWALPRLSGPPKAALVEIQADEYGGGRPERIHAAAVRRLDGRPLGLDSTYGAYLEQIPGVTLATVNLMSLFGLHRRLRGAIVGHLALFEMTSSIPNRRYATGLRRLGFDEPRRPSSSTSTSRPTPCTRASPRSTSPAAWPGRSRRSARDILWGARALLAIDGRWARHLMAAWERGASSLRTPLPARAAAA